MTGLTRRAALGVTAAGLLTGAATAPARAAMAPGLNALARARGLRFGSATAALDPAGGSVSNPAYATLLQADVGLLVAENEMKWQALRPGPNSFAFDAFDRIVAFARAQGMALRGHTLLWHRDRWMPGWLSSYDFGARPAAGAEALLTSHIQTVIRRYRADIQAFDVVNEAVSPDDGTLIETALSRPLGGAQATLDLAFHTARAEAPQAQLVYNDYMSWEPGNEKHRAGVLRLLEGFRARGVPVDALGVQSHLNQNSVARPQEREWSRFIEAVVAMGYRLVITEFDVRGNALSADIARRDAEVTTLARGYLDLMLSFPALHDVLVWGLSNRFSWLRDFEPRPDHLETRGCLYDDQLRPTPLRTAVAAALQAAPVRG